MVIKNPFKKNNKQKEAVGGTKVRIKVYRKIGGQIPAEIADFVAEFEKDKDFNIYLTNQKEEFKEAITIVKQKIIDDLKYRLDLVEFSHDEKKEEVKKAIEKQEDRIRRIKNGYLYNSKEARDANDENKREKVNKFDEEKYLTGLKVLEQDLKNGVDKSGEMKGSYEYFNGLGERAIDFEYHDGILYPIFHPANTATNYTDMASKRKIYADTDYDIDKEFVEETASPWQNFFGKALWFLAIVVLISGIIWNAENQKNHIELQEMIDKGTLQKVFDQSAASITYCAAVYKQMVEGNGELINYAIKDITNKSQQKEIEKDEAQKIIDLTKKVTGNDGS